MVIRGARGVAASEDVLHVGVRLVRHHAVVVRAVHLHAAVRVGERRRLRAAHLANLVVHLAVLALESEAPLPVHLIRRQRVSEFPVADLRAVHLQGVLFDEETIVPEVVTDDVRRRDGFEPKVAILEALHRRAFHKVGFALRV